MRKKGTLRAFFIDKLLQKEVRFVIMRLIFIKGLFVSPGANSRASKSIPVGSLLRGVESVVRLFFRWYFFCNDWICAAIP